MRFGSLFTGFGGMDLGLERAGMECAFQVEIDDYATRVLEKHWPKVPRWRDIREVNGDELPSIDVFAGGFPCQDLSHAGKRAGIGGDRSGLWSEYLRLVDEKKAPWIVIENVHQAWRNWVPVVRRDLWSIGYSSLPLRLSAAELGADHRRTRCFVIAHADGEFLRDLSRRWIGPRREVASQPLDARWGTATSRVARVADGIPHGVERRRGIGNAVVPQAAEQIGRLILAVAQ